MQVGGSSFAASWLIAGAALGTLVALLNYFMPGNGISGTEGALLVVASSALLAWVGFALRRRLAGGRGVGLLLPLVALILVSGTAFAAWLLEARVLFALMVLAGAGWVALVLRSRAA
jgi:hypothetical protein